MSILVPLSVAETPVREVEPLIAFTTADAAVPLAKLSCSVPYVPPTWIVTEETVAPGLIA